MEGGADAAFGGRRQVLDLASSTDTKGLSSFRCEDVEIIEACIADPGSGERLRAFSGGRLDDKHSVPCLCAGGQDAENLLLGGFASESFLER